MSGEPASDLGSLAAKLARLERKWVNRKFNRLAVARRKIGDSKKPRASE